MANISFVIPCYKSAETIPFVLEEIESVMGEREDLSYEVITVVDGSPDNVFDVLKEASKSRPYLKVINLSRNFGQSSAQMAGFREANGDVVVALDDDGQCPLDQLWNLLTPVMSGEADFAVARYKEKKQSAFKNFGSRMNQAMARSLVGMPKDFEMSNFYAFTKLVNTELANYPNPHPYFLGNIFQTTNRSVNVPMEERERISGSTNYTFKKLISLWLSGFTSYSIKPLRVADFIGVVCAVIGFVYGIYTIIAKLTMDIAAGYASLIASILFIGGIVMILLGLIGEYVGRIMLLLNNTPQYVVRQIICDGQELKLIKGGQRGPRV